MATSDRRRTHRVYVPHPPGYTPSSQPADVLRLVAGSNVTLTPVVEADGSITLTVDTSGGSGTVTSVGFSGGTTGFGVTGGPVTTSGTITLTVDNPATVRTNLGLSAWSTTTGSAYGTPVYDSSAAPSSVAAPSAGTRVGRSLVWTSDTVRDWEAPEEWFRATAEKQSGSASNYFTAGYPATPSTSGTATAPDNYTNLYTATATTGSKAGPAWAANVVMPATPVFRLRMKVRTGSSLAVCRVYAGLTTSAWTNVVPASQGSDYAAIRYSTVEGDTGWTLVTRSNSGTVATVYLGAIATSTDYDLRIWSDGSNVYASIGNGSPVSVSTVPRGGQFYLTDIAVITNENVAKAIGVQKVQRLVRG